MVGMATIIRVFRAIARRGRADEFRAFFVGEAVSTVRRQPGLLSIEVGLPLEEGDEFLMITVWRDLESIRSFAGEDWRRPYLASREKALVAEASVSHFERANG